jgi:catechol 2,3-dioxygenase-like lactoylglutathione lyase family enzyme
MSSLTGVAPELPVRDLAEALEYYTGRLGFEVATVMPDRDYAIVERDAVCLHLFTAAERSPGSVHVFTGELDQLFGELDSRGALITQDVIRTPWGNREFRVADPAGNTIKFTEPAGEPRRG